MIRPPCPTWLDDPPAIIVPRPRFPRRREFFTGHHRACCCGCPSHVHITLSGLLLRTCFLGDGQSPGSTAWYTSEDDEADGEYEVPYYDFYNGHCRYQLTDEGSLNAAKMWFGDGVTDCDGTYYQHTKYTYTITILTDLRSTVVRVSVSSLLAYGGEPNITKYNFYSDEDDVPAAFGDPIDNYTLPVVVGDITLTEDSWHYGGTATVTL